MCRCVCVCVCGFSNFVQFSVSYKQLSKVCYSHGNSLFTETINFLCQIFLSPFIYNLFQSRLKQVFFFCYLTKINFVIMKFNETTPNNQIGIAIIALFFVRFIWMFGFIFIFLRNVSIFYFPASSGLPVKLGSKIFEMRDMWYVFSIKFCQECFSFAPLRI